eukprot:16429993-Heterocapsa_arctica.AAC.2
MATACCDETHGRSPPPCKPARKQASTGTCSSLHTGKENLCIYAGSGYYSSLLFEVSSRT